MYSTHCSQNINSKMQKIPVISLYKVLSWIPTSFRKMSKFLPRVYRVLKNWILLNAQQHFLQDANLGSTLQLSEILSVLQTCDFWALKHAIFPLPEYFSSFLFLYHPFLPHHSSHFFWKPNFMSSILVRWWDQVLGQLGPSSFIRCVCVFFFLTVLQWTICVHIISLRSVNSQAHLHLALPSLSFQFLALSLAQRKPSINISWMNWLNKPS